MSKNVILAATFPTVASRLYDMYLDQRAHADQGQRPSQIEIDPALPQELGARGLIDDERDNAGDHEHRKAVHQNSQGGEREGAGRRHVLGVTGMMRVL